MQQPATLRVAMGFMPFPRGGSSFVVQELTKRLPEFGVQRHLFAGSLGDASAPGNAERFFGSSVDPTELHTLDYTMAAADYAAGRDQFATDPPMQASFEAKSGVPDRVFASVSPERGRAMEAAWARLFTEAGGAESFDVAHLHHITPQYEFWSRQPVALVGHLHGTDLKFLVEAESRLTGGRREGDDATDWTHAQYWTDKFRAWARSTDLLIAVAPEDIVLAQDVLELPEDRLVFLRNGVDVDVFYPRPTSTEDARRVWQHVLVTDAQGWDSTKVIGSVSYTSEEVERAFFRPDGSREDVLLCVCRFLEWKRLRDVIDAHIVAQREYGLSAPLVLWGGYPGEVEGEHPVDYARRRGATNVFFTGWRSLDDLALGYNAASVMVNAAEAEPFGTAMIQALSSGLPAISTRAGGPLSYMSDEGPDANGWFYSVGDIGELARLMSVSCSDEAQRSLRGMAARSARERYDWTNSVRDLMEIYGEARSRMAARVR